MNERKREREQDAVSKDFVINSVQHLFSLFEGEPNARGTNRRFGSTFCDIFSNCVCVCIACLFVRRKSINRMTRSFDWLNLVERW
jgi:hypothetical protein